MSELTFQPQPATRNSFADLAPTPAEHFKLYLYSAILVVLNRVFEVYDSPEAAFAQFPFLHGYYEELAADNFQDLSGESVTRRFYDSLETWEQKIAGSTHLPLRALREAGNLSREAISMLMCIGLFDEDARFGALFAAMQGGMAAEQLPTANTLKAWWRKPDGDNTAARADLRRLQTLGLVEISDPNVPRVEWKLQPSAILWDQLRGEFDEQPAAWARYRSPALLVPRERLMIPDALRQSFRLLPKLFESGEAQALIVRGARHNGRRALLGSLALEMKRGLLEAEITPGNRDERLILLGSLAAAMNALPVVVLDLAPGETIELPTLSGCKSPLCVVLGKQGGVQGSGVRRALTFAVVLPGRDARYQLWRQSFDSKTSVEVGELETISERFRLTSGNIRRAANLARAYAALDNSEKISAAHVQKASRTLNRQALDTLAGRVEATGDWDSLAVGDDTRRGLHELESRCRHRERLPQTINERVASGLTAGVRALFTGTSGTGKTLAARLLAASLQMDLYRLDLSTVVNKYIGETEKNLDRIFSRAEELDVILLLDEGDALLTQRTNVQSSNDRYANLETNYLLQRLETYEGILIITTNAKDRIDNAFERRMDAVIEFRAPDAPERRAIWQLHLPVSHVVESDLLDEISRRCALAGGQIRNAVLHASLLALDAGETLDKKHLLPAVQREYRKAGEICPLRNYDSNDHYNQW
jgi:hypothetical protein